MGVRRMEALWSKPGDDDRVVGEFSGATQDCAHLSVYDNGLSNAPHAVAAVRALLKGGAPWREVE